MVDHLEVWVAVVVLTAASVIIDLAPGLRFTVVWAGVRQPLEAVGAFISILAAALGYLWFAATGTRRALLVAIAFLVVGVNQIVFGVVFQPERSLDSRPNVYLWATGRLIAGVLLLIAAWDRKDTPPPSRHPFLVFAGSSLAALSLLAVVQAMVWAGRDTLPALCCEVPGSLAARGVAPGLTATAWVLSLAGAALYAAAAFGFLAGAPDREPASYPQGDWLSLALIIGVFSHIHYLLYPTVFSDRVATGDLLRVAQFCVVFFGLLWEIKVLLQRERERTAQLAAVSEVREEVSRIVTHDLVHSVATVKVFASSLAARWTQLDEPARAEAVDRIERQAARLKDLADETVAALAADRTDLRLTMAPLRLGDLACQAVETVDGMRGRLIMDTDHHQNPVVRGDESVLRRVLLNLLWNAEEHAPEGSPIEIAVRADAGWAEVTIADRGPGMPPEGAAPKRSRGTAEAPGWGVGLRRSRDVLAEHGGRLEARARPEGGTVFALLLPLEDPTR